MEKVCLKLPIHTYDIDYNGHVSNIVFIRWAEILRVALLEAVGLPLQSLKDQGCFPVLVETQMVYKQPLYYGDVVQAELWISELSKIFCWMEFRFLNGGGILAATGRQKGVFINVETTRPTRITEEQRQKFKRFLQIDA
jgi:acyl-CoA thioester hydrolase